MHGLVLTAAGSSTRFGGGPSKVLLPLHGVPIVARAAEAFREAFPDLAVVVTTRPEDRAAVLALAKGGGALRGAVVVEGGDTRRQSVELGIAALAGDVEVILVHDAARPLVTADLVRRVVEAALCDGAAAPALPLSDSVHRSDGAGRLVETLDRAALRAVQTPQAARADLLRRAFARPQAREAQATDEVALLVAAGIPVTEVAGDPDNLKVTTPRDLRLAEEIFARRRAGGPRPPPAP